MKKLSTSTKIAEVDFVSDKAVMLYKNNPALADDASLKSIIDETEVESDRITEAIKRDRVFSDMEEVDMQVEKDARTLKTIVKGYAAMPNEELSTAAKAVLAVIEKFKYSMFKLPLAQQAPNVEAMLMDLSAQPIAAHTNVLPTVPETLEKLRQSQKNFMDKNAAYLKAYAQDADMLSATELRKTLLRLINGKLLVYLSAAVMMNPEKYGTYVLELEKVIEDINQKVRQRTDKKKKNEEEPQ